ncbi:hypothetical protein LBWT_X4110 (plasmid) [Leptolyngbya boryana IAM M-101]|nr:hypothetical protein LBWT_X4110 [Leptolyngbya boryana IAM M-101]BAS66687.1 hypothetical protein LBDG_X4110 [Leptolyngbya boryana dg5]
MPLLKETHARSDHHLLNCDLRMHQVSIQLIASIKRDLLAD